MKKKRAEPRKDREKPRKRAGACHVPERRRPPSEFTQCGAGEVPAGPALRQASLFSVGVEKEQ